MDLEEFIARMNFRNQWLRYKGLETYYRKGGRVLEGKLLSTLERANTSNITSSKPRNEKLFKLPVYTRTGYYRELSELTEQLARKYKFEAVFVENVVSPFLPDKLKEWGYKEYPSSIGRGLSVSFYKLIKE